MEKNLVFTTQAGDPADVSKVAIFGEGDEFRNSKYGPQFKWALRGIYCPILGIDDVGDDKNPFLVDNNTYSHLLNFRNKNRTCFEPLIEILNLF